MVKLLNKIFLVLLLAWQCFSASHCIRPENTYNGDGTTWGAAASAGAAGAFNVIPAVLTRGDTYYLGDGAYSKYTFNDATSGTLVITIKKATVSAHGVETDWDNSYGDGQALFSVSATTWEGILGFTTDYYVIDGSVGGGRDAWTSGHGIKLVGGSNIFYGIKCGDAAQQTGVHNISVSHVEISGDRETVVDQRSFLVYYCSNIHFSQMYIHDIYKEFGGLIHTDTCSLKDSYLTRSGNSFIDIPDAIHNGGVSIRNNDSVDIAYNVFVDVSENGYIYMVNDAAGEAISSVNIHGNVFYQTRLVEGSYNLKCFNFSRPNTVATNFKFVNNTIYNTFVQNGTGGNAGILSDMVNGGGNVMSNNVWVSNDMTGFLIPSGWTHDYNYYNGNTFTTPTEANSQSATGEIFVDVSEENFNLVTATNGGSSFAYPISIDPLGKTRGADGVWDRGAFEYNAKSRRMVVSW